MIDIVLPYFNPYIHNMVSGLYLYYVWGEYGEKEKVIERFRKLCIVLFNELKRNINESEIWKRYISEKELEFAKEYYCMEGINYNDYRDIIIGNKECFTKINCSETINSIMLNWMSCFCDSWIEDEEEERDIVVKKKI